MPRNVIGNTPFTLRVVDSDRPLSSAEISAQLHGQTSMTLLVRSEAGPANRGGYFFHIERVETGYQIYDFEKSPVAILEAERLIRFINHTSGRQFDEEMLLFCQSVVNLRQDQTET